MTILYLENLRQNYAKIRDCYYFHFNREESKMGSHCKRVKYF